MKDQQKSILVLDDDPVILLSIKKMLKKSGYEVDVETSGQKGLELLIQNYNLVICDIRLDDLNGFQILDYIIENNIPSEILLMTGYEELSLMEPEYQKRVSRTLMKPFNFDSFLNVVSDLLGAN